MAGEGETSQKKQKTAEHGGYGKLILFGEHFVVYDGVPALVAAVGAQTTCTAKLLDEPGLKVIDDRPAVPHYKVKKKEEGAEAINLVLKHMEFDPAKQGLELLFAGDLTCVSGIGASAAQCVAMARALASATGKALTQEEVNKAAYEGEKGYHGTPSGIDNTASTYGGLLEFKRTADGPAFETKSLPKACHIVYASTGITASTTAVVGDVRALKDKEPETFGRLLDEYTALVPKAQEQLLGADWEGLAASVDANHKILQQLTVSCKELDNLVDVAKQAGAIGAKMSGTGRGGLMFAITPGEELQAKVAEALEAHAPQVWKTTIQ